MFFLRAEGVMGQLNPRVYPLDDDIGYCRSQKKIMILPQGFWK